MYAILPVYGWLGKSLLYCTSNRPIWYNMYIGHVHVHVHGTLTEEISEQIFSKERRRLQAKHLWMVVKLEELDALLFDRAARRNRTDPYEEKKYRGSGIKEVQAWWKKCQDWMAHFKEQSEPFVFDFKKLLMALSDKEAVAQSEVDAFMENCAKRWQTREGTYQLKRRRLKPDVRDSPEYPCADIDMADI